MLHYPLNYILSDSIKATNLLRYFIGNQGVNLISNFASLLGLLDLLLALGSISLSVLLAIQIKNIPGIVLYVIQGFLASSILFLSGLIFFFQGWRLDPILQFAVFLLHVLIIYLIGKDIYLFSSFFNNNGQSSRETRR